MIIYNYIYKSYSLDYMDLYGPLWGVLQFWGHPQDPVTGPDFSRSPEGDMIQEPITARQAHRERVADSYGFCMVCFGFMQMSCGF